MSCSLLKPYPSAIDPSVLRRVSAYQVYRLPTTLSVQMESRYYVVAVDHHVLQSELPAVQRHHFGWHEIEVLGRSAVNAGHGVVPRHMPDDFSGGSSLLRLFSVVEPPHRFNITQIWSVTPVLTGTAQPCLTLTPGV